MTVATSVLWKINTHVVKKWPEKVIQRPFFHFESVFNCLGDHSYGPLLTKLNIIIQPIYLDLTNQKCQPSAANLTTQHTTPCCWLLVFHQNSFQKSRSGRDPPWYITLSSMNPRLFHEIDIFTINFLSFFLITSVEWINSLKNSYVYTNFTISM